MYVAVPHNLHAKIYGEVLEARKDLLAEKPFGIDLVAAEQIAAAVQSTKRFVRCSSEFPLLPGPQRAIQTMHSSKRSCTKSIDSRVRVNCRMQKLRVSCSK